MKLSFKAKRRVAATKRFVKKNTYFLDLYKRTKINISVIDVMLIAIFAMVFNGQLIYGQIEAFERMAFGDAAWIYSSIALSYMIAAKFTDHVFDKYNYQKVYEMLLKTRIAHLSILFIVFISPSVYVVLRIIIDVFNVPFSKACIQKEMNYMANTGNMEYFQKQETNLIAEASIIGLVTGILLAISVNAYTLVCISAVIDVFVYILLYKNKYRVIETIKDELTVTKKI